MPYRAPALPTPASSRPRPEPPRGYWPWVLQPAPLIINGPGTTFGSVQTGLSFYRDHPRMAEYLLIAGDLEGAHLSLRDAATQQEILSCVPAWLYAVPAMPTLDREGEMLQLVWPAGAPVPARLPTFPVFYGSHVTLTWERLKPQPKGLTAVLLCRDFTEEELAIIQRG